jgi:hypothetical protein
LYNVWFRLIPRFPWLRESDDDLIPMARYDFIEPFVPKLRSLHDRLSQRQQHFVIAVPGDQRQAKGHPVKFRKGQ